MKVKIKYTGNGRFDVCFVVVLLSSHYIWVHVCVAGRKLVMLIDLGEKFWSSSDLLGPTVGNYRRHRRRKDEMR